MTATPRLTTLEQLVDSYAARRGHSAIVSFGAPGSMTQDYGVLHDEIRRVAGGLRAQGIGVGDMVLLWAPNSTAWVASYFGIVTSGATAVPLDNQVPVERAAVVLAHSGAKLAFTVTTHAAELERAGLTGFPSLLLDGDESDSHSWRRLEGARELPSAPDPTRVASLLYTSGTTGVPKAVPLTHGNLAANVSALCDAKLIDTADVVLVPLPFHHVYPFTVGLLTVLATGACVVLPSGISGPEITRAATESGATALIAVPRLCTAIWEGVERGVRKRGKRAERLFRLMLALSRGLRRATGIKIGKLLFKPLHDQVGAELRTLGCGGAQLDGDLARNLEGLGWTVLTGYGLTETSPVLTFNQHKRRKLGTEGITLPGVELKTFAHPDFEHGEIIARGPNVFSGYWKNPEETRKAFTDDGWFKTGDLGWIDKRGYLHIAGRSKEVIVLPDGKNVFPDEIEDEFAASTLIEEIAVLDREGRLHALVVPDDHAIRERGAHRVEELLKEEIAAVSLRLPPYQRLSDYRITRVPLPRTPLGKLKRHLLAEAYTEAATRKVAPAAVALSDDDRALVETDPVRKVWSWLKTRYADRTLTLETSPQLDLNIDSLEWVTLTLELEREFNVSLDGAAVSRIVTVRDLLREVQTAPAPGPRSARELPTIEPPNAWWRSAGALLFAANRWLVRSRFRFEIVGVDTLPPPDASFVIAPNHVSYLDPLAIAAALPRGYLPNVHWAGWAGKMHEGPLMRFVSRATRVFPVEPDRDPTSAIALGRSVLEQRRILVWFPEGRRSLDGKLQRFQAGIGLMLDDDDACAVPTAVLGAFEAWPRERRFPLAGNSVKVIFGRPMSRAELLAAGRGDSDAERIADGLETAVASLIGVGAASRRD
jgi:long-chain acyl-CoA synthetase